jgi:glucose/arabinose dehydrogenase
MKPSRSLVLLASAALALGCGQGSSGSRSSDAPIVPPPTAEPAPPPPEPMAGILLLGVQDGEAPFTRAEVIVRSFQVEIDGAPVALGGVPSGPLELTRSDHAWLLGEMPVPPVGSTVSVSLRFEPCATFDDGDPVTDPILADTRGAPLTFEISGDYFHTPARHAVIHLDLDASLSTWYGPPRLVPTYRVFR